MRKSDLQRLEALSRAVRARCLTMSTNAGSGHPTSSLSATDVMTGLFFGGHLRYDVENPDYPGNDRVIFSKGHASPLYYALWAAAGGIDDAELETYRKLGSRLEGHPRPNFPYAEAATGSLGQGLSIGTGMAWAAKHDHHPYRTYVLLGDSELAEGSNWEAIELAGHWKLEHLYGIVDCNRLGQRGQTLHGRDADALAERVAAFGWRTFVIDGHDHAAIARTLDVAGHPDSRPTMIIAKTKKGKGVSVLEDLEGWHGKPLPEDKLQAALGELGEADLSLKGSIALPPRVTAAKRKTGSATPPTYKVGDEVPTRLAFGETLAKMVKTDESLVVMDGEVGNSTHADLSENVAPDRYIECYIAEQHMASMALGVARRGFRPVAATFGAFLARAHDQARMAAYSEVDITFVGSHAGVSIGEDGPSQMALEDLAQFRTVHGSTVLYPSDATSSAALTQLAIAQSGISYLRTTRGKTPVIYKSSEAFTVGGSKTVRRSPKDVSTIVAAGITLHEALAAADELKKDKINVRVIDAYSVKPLDEATIRKAAEETNHIITVEDHYPEGGLGEAVASAIAGTRAKLTLLAVRDIVGSGTPLELLHKARIDRTAIIEAVRNNT